jgi:tetratricopeptide (TPR) repeat protein
MRKMLRCVLAPLTPAGPAIRHARRGGALLTLVAGLLLAHAALPGGTARGQNLEDWYRDGMAHLARGRSAAAEATFRRVLAEAPDHFRSHVALGQMFLGPAPQRALEHLQIACTVAPGYEQAHDLRGQALERLNRFAEAAEAYRQVIRINPSNREANTRLRTLLRTLQDQQTRGEQAEARFRAAPSLRTLTLFGQILTAEARPDEALAKLEAIRRDLPGLPEVNLWIARAHRAAGSPDGEVEAYRRYLAVNPDALGVRLLLAERLEATGRLRTALEVLSPADLAPERAAGLERADRARLAYLRSRALVAPGDWAGVGASLLEAGRLGYDPERVTAAYNDDLALHDGQGALWSSLAEWSTLRGDPEAATQARVRACQAEAARCAESRKALQAQLGAGKPPEWVRLALAEIALGDSQSGEALEHLRHIPQRHAAYRRAALLRGIVLHAQGETARAVDALLQYVFLFPDRAGMLFARGTVFWELGERDLAIAVWQEEPGVLAAYPELLKRLTAHLQTSNDAAERAFREQLAQAQPELVSNTIRLGDLLRAQGKTMDAVRSWRAALAQRPRDGAVLQRIGRAYLDLGRTDEGVNTLLQAWQLQNLPRDLALTLARALAARQRPAEALAVYWQLYRDSPADSDAALALPELALAANATGDVRQTAAQLAAGAGRADVAAKLGYRPAPALPAAPPTGRDQAISPMQLEPAPAVHP